MKLDIFIKADAWRFERQVQRKDDARRAVAALEEAGKHVGVFRTGDCGLMIYRTGEEWI